MTMLPEFVEVVPLNEAELQVRIQDVVNREWPQWKRERAMRLGGAELLELNAFFATLEPEVDAARTYSVDLAAALLTPVAVEEVLAAVEEI
jgi:hypothetical protein